MGGYIERERARNVICGWCEYDSCLADDYYWDKCDAKRRLDDIPSADVVPVVHGHWIDPTGRPKSTQFVCSVCNQTAYFPQNNHKTASAKRCGYVYCPYCMAKMDDEDKK